MIENPMAIDSLWELYEKAVKEKLNGAGYREMHTGIFVAEEDAFEYAIEHCTECVPVGFRQIKWTEEFKRMVVEWFYSGNWISI